MKIYFIPETLAGKWAVGFGIALVASTALSLFFAAAIGGDPDIIEASTLLTILANMLSIIFSLAGPLSLVVGIFAIVKYKDYSVWKALALLYFLSALMFLLAEFIFPH